MGRFGIGFSGVSGSGGGGATSSTPTYPFSVTSTITQVTVPLATMVCTDNTVVFLNGALLNSGVTRTANVFDFSFDLVDGDYLLFKN